MNAPTGTEVQARWHTCGLCGGGGSLRPRSGDPQDAEPCPRCLGDGIVLSYGGAA